MSESWIKHNIKKVFLEAKYNPFGGNSGRTTHAALIKESTEKQWMINLDVWCLQSPRMQLSYWMTSVWHFVQILANWGKLQIVFGRNAELIREHRCYPGWQEIGDSAIYFLIHEKSFTASKWLHLTATNEKALVWFTCTVFTSTESGIVFGDSFM